MSVEELEARDHLGTGVFRRRVALLARAGAVLAGLEDDAHHFELGLHHDGHRVTACSGRAVRYPWSVCPGAVERLQEIAGTPLSSRPQLMGPLPGHHCTHLYDLARLAIAQAIRGGDRIYDLTVPDGSGRQALVALSREGQQLAEWTLDRNGKPVAEKVHIDDLSDDDISEARLVMRRGLSVGTIRRPGFERHRWGPAGSRMTSDERARQGVCHAHQAPQIDMGSSMENFQDSTHNPHLLLHDLLARGQGHNQHEIQSDCMQNLFAKIAHRRARRLL